MATAVQALRRLTPYTRRTALQHHERMRTFKTGTHCWLFRRRTLSAYARVERMATVQEPYAASTRTSTKARACRRSSSRGQNILVDYASVVATLVETFAEVAEQDALITYRDLVTADSRRDPDSRLRPRSQWSACRSAPELISCVAPVNMVLAAVCSLDRSRRPLYPTGRELVEANEYLQRVRLGQTNQGSVARITLLGPVVSPHGPDVARTRHRPICSDPIERRVIEALGRSAGGGPQGDGRYERGEFGRVSCRRHEPRGQRQSVRSAGHTDRGTTGTRYQCRMGTDMATGRSPDRHAIRCSRRPRSA